jgi:hypothetical protein
MEAREAFIERGGRTGEGGGDGGAREILQVVEHDGLAQAGGRAARAASRCGAKSSHQAGTAAVGSEESGASPPRWPRLGSNPP